MKRWAVLAAMLFVLFASSQALARGGGGCLAKGTPVLTPSGHVAIERLRVGDAVWSISDGRLQTGTVQVLSDVHTDHYLEIVASEEKILITSEHPIMVGPGEYRIARMLKAGENVYRFSNGSLRAVPVTSVRHIRSNQPAYNLLVIPGGTFMPAGIVVHNKGGGGGCFPAGTMIRTPSGQEPIESLSIHDRVRTVDPEGHIINSSVEKLFTTLTCVLLVKTNRGVLRTTIDHPVGLPDGTFREAGDLRPGNDMLVWDRDALIPATVLGTSTSEGKELVYNLSVGQPHTFLAADFLVHNKGGSSSHSSSSSSGSNRGDCADDIACKILIITFVSVFVLVFVVIIWVLVRVAKDGKSENLDYTYKQAEVEKKAQKTEKLLAFLSRQDPSVSTKALHPLAESTFRKLQECWQKRDFGPMQPLLMHDLFRQHSAQLQGLIRNHEINRIDDLKIERIDLINVRYTNKPDQREFTALITASARDYYMDDRTSKFLRGDKRPALFQEFWTFQRSGDHWLLREIEQAGESDILKDENFVEMLTDQTIKGIYEEAAAKEGTAGPWIEKTTAEKATRIERLLNFLVQTDKIWDRNQMLERARQMFMNLFLARESGDPAQLPQADMFPNVADSLRKQLQQWQMEGRAVEYRNICVRKAELILVRNYTDPAKDEFTVRISAHAQKIERKAQMVLSEQQYVTPFEEYWTFGRLDKVWKLKEVLPPARGEKMMTEENVDEDSSAGQMQWYYREKRAV